MKLGEATKYLADRGLKLDRSTVSKKLKAKGLRAKWGNITENVLQSILKDAKGKRKACAAPKEATVQATASVVAYNASTPEGRVTARALEALKFDIASIVDAALDVCEDAYEDRNLGFLCLALAMYKHTPFGIKRDEWKNVISRYARLITDPSSILILNAFGVDLVALAELGEKEEGRGE